MKKQIFEEFRKMLMEIYNLNSALALIFWDQEIYMPKNGAEPRSKTVATLAGVIHEKFTSKEFEQMIEKIAYYNSKGDLSRKEAIIFREISRDFYKAKKLPVEFVQEMSEVCSIAQVVWAEARQKKDFKLFEPYLEKIVAFKIKEASLLGFTDSPYDALLDGYEPGVKAKEIEEVFAELKIFLVDMIEKIGKSKIKIKPGILKGKFSEEKQMKFNAYIAEKIGFDFGSGRLDKSTHPFSTGINPRDVRITTRYREDDLFYSASSTIHETGHAIYEQGLKIENFGTPIGESASLGIHESQSRIWEKIVGQSMVFWKYFYPKLRKDFAKPFAKISLMDFYKAINHVKPSLIRTKSDEVTYNLHIILRFEIEKDLIEGKIKVKDLPKNWNAKMKQYFNIDVPDDAMGVLQDVHWSGGSFGYFPSYTLGNLYSAQLFESAKRDMPRLEKDFSEGKFGNFKAWLGENIHRHGKTYPPSELIKRISGQELDSRFFIEYIRNKYKNIYEL